MAARWTGIRMTGIALAALSLSTVTRAQVGYTGPIAGCFGVMCVPVVSVGAYTVPGFVVPWAVSGATFSNQVEPGKFPAEVFTAGSHSRDYGSSTLASNRVGSDHDAKGDQRGRGDQNDRGDQDDQGHRGNKSHVSRFNPATIVYTGLAATALVSFLNSSNGVSSLPAVESSEETPTVTAPITAHVEFAPATALMATTALVATPEPMTQTLMATGLVAVGLLAFVRRRRRSIG